MHGFSRSRTCFGLILFGKRNKKIILKLLVYKQWNALGFFVSQLKYWTSFRRVIIFLHIARWTKEMPVITKLIKLTTSLSLSVHIMFSRRIFHPICGFFVLFDTTSTGIILERDVWYILWYCRHEVWHWHYINITRIFDFESLIITFVNVHGSMLYSSRQFQSVCKLNTR